MNQPNPNQPNEQAQAARNRSAPHNGKEATSATATSTANGGAATTYVDEEIGKLEAQLPALQAERARLLAGQVEVRGLGGEQAVTVDLAQLVALADDKPAQTEQLHALLTGSPVFAELVQSYRTKEEITADMVAAGVLPNEALKLDPKTKAKIAGYKLAIRVDKDGPGLISRVQKWLNSPWVLAVGLVLLLVWGGGWALSAWLGAGNSSSTTSTKNRAVAATQTARAATLTPNPDSGPNKTVGTGNGVNYMMFRAEATPGEGNDPSLTPTVFANPYSPTTTTSSTIPTTSATTPNYTPTPAPTVSPALNSTSNVGTGAGAGNYNRVGQPPTDLGGLNGPHGAFLAPSRLAVTALSVDVPVEKAIVEEQRVLSAKDQTNSSSPILTPAAAITPLVAQSVVWPRPGEVLHIGAFPGEIGNCIILGTQQNLAALRRLQQNDLIKLYDRDKNVYSYRVVAFSASGQPERVVNPGWSGDNWIFQPDTAGQALLTIVVSMPQPLPPVDPSKAGSNQAGAGNSGAAQGAGPASNSAKDDFTSSQKLAYRAVLVGFVPTQATPQATPVPVDESVWQTQPLPRAATPTPPIPTPVPVSSTLTQPPDQALVFDLLIQAAALVANSNLTQHTGGR